MVRKITWGRERKKEGKREKEKRERVRETQRERERERVVNVIVIASLVVLSPFILSLFPTWRRVPFKGVFYINRRFSYASASIIR